MKGSIRHTLVFAGACSLFGCDAEAAPSGSSAQLQAADPEFPVIPANDGSVPNTDGGSGDAGVRLVDSGTVVDLTCPRGGNTGPIRVAFGCGEITVVTCKDLSNVVIEYDDGSRQRVEGLKGLENTFGAPGGRSIVGVWVKAGANASGDGPGFGERFNAPAGSCQDGSTGVPDGGTGTGDAGAGDSGTSNPPPAEPPPTTPPVGEGPGLVN